MGEVYEGGQIESKLALFNAKLYERVEKVKG